MDNVVELRVLQVTAADGARARVQLHLPASPQGLMYWLPALGVGIRPNVAFAEAIAARGFAVAVHEWRGLGESNRRAGRGCDWGYRELLGVDIAAGMDAVAKAVPGLRCTLGGHSLGGQLALLEAARRDGIEQVFLVASGHPYWAGFPGMRAWGVRLFAHAIAPITALAGHFPGARLGFAGREAAGLMRDWSLTARRGNYRLPEFGDELDAALQEFRGHVVAVQMQDDALAPRGSLHVLQRLAPNAHWRIDEFSRERFRSGRADHFGWLREPGPVVDAFRQGFHPTNRGK